MSSAALPTRPVPRANVLEIEAYVPGKSHAAPGVKVHKLSSNESPLGASPKALAAFQSTDALEIYPDGSSTKLREAIGATYGLDPARIVCGTGSDELINLIAHAYAGPGDEVVYSQYGFLIYRIARAGRRRVAGGRPGEGLPHRRRRAAGGGEREDAHGLPRQSQQPDRHLSAVRRGEAAAALAAAHVLLVLDAAYAEYVRRNDYESGIELVATCTNVVMLRTFSKIHGLAALRVGWLYGPAEVVDALNRIRGAFNISAPGLAAATAAIGDVAHTEAAVAHNETWLPWLTAELTALGLDVTPSVANFLLVHFPDVPGRSAGDADAFLMQRGLIVRRVDAYGIPGALRLSVGTEEANRLLVATLAEFLGKTSSGHGA